MSTPAITPEPRPTSWPPAAKQALAFLLGVIATLIAGQFRPFFNRPHPTTLESPSIAAVVDLNRASKAELKQLPKVSDKRAEAIVSKREQLGEFVSPSQLRSVPGIGDKRLEDLQPFVKVSSGTQNEWVRSPVETKFGKKEPPAAPLDVNRAEIGDLQRLPGIGPTLAARIVAERERAPFRVLEDLRRVSGIGAKTLEKLRPFVRFDDAN